MNTQAAMSGLFNAQSMRVSIGVSMIIPEKVERDDNGQWTHTEWEKFCNDREAVPKREVDEWLDKHGLELSIVSLEDEDESSPAFIDYFEKGGADISGWTLSPPPLPENSLIKGHHHHFGAWFLLSVNDTEDGPVQLWARKRAKEAL